MYIVSYLIKLAFMNIQIYDTRVVIWKSVNIQRKCFMLLDQYFNLFVKFVIKKLKDYAIFFSEFRFINERFWSADLLRLHSL